jgi:hypothetical protein
MPIGVRVYVHPLDDGAGDGDLLDQLVNRRAPESAGAEASASTPVARSA